jgi:hypothetical protein
VDNDSDTSRFLQAVFGTDYGSHGIFANLNPPAHSRDGIQLNLKRDCYWSIAAFPDDGSLKRTLARATEVRALVIDDVGSKVPESAVELALGEPTAIVETSPGNFQWSYRLAKPVAVAQWAGLFAEIEHLVGMPLEGRDAVHLFRLPCGVNTKPGRDGFAVRLVKLNPGIALSVGKHPDFPTLAKSSPFDATPRVRDMLALARLLPNEADVSRQEWVERAHQFKALALDETCGREAFDLWSQKHKSYDAAETARVWDSLPDQLRTAGLEVLKDAEAADASAFAGIVNAEARMVFDDGEAAPEVPCGKGRVKFELGSKKEILRSRVNAERGILGRDIRVSYDAFHHRTQLERSGRTELVTDHTVMLLRVELTEVYGKDFGTVVMWDAVLSLALQNQFNPVCEMLDEAERDWDGVRRLDRLGPDYFNTEDTEPARACFRKVMIAAVRRARHPGCKFDQILVCESPEGWNKSSAWEALAGRENFSDESILGKNTREVQEQLADIWIHENADLAGLHKSEVEQIKAFASRTNDRARPAYGRVLLNQPRQSIEVGTTNAESYLLSATGNRRFWPFMLRQPIELDRLRQDRLQLWGEAAAAESSGETLVLAKRLWPVMGEAQEQRRVIDTWEIELENLPPNLIEMRDGWEHITGLAVQEYLSGYRRQTFNSGSGRKIAEIMKRLGWERAMFRVDGRPLRGYKRQGPTICNASGTPSVTKNPF